MRGTREWSPGPDRETVREVTLVEGERIQQRFVPEKGLVESTPGKGPLLVLTTRRMMSFNQVDGRQETTLIGLADLRAVSIRRQGRHLRQLFQGVGLVLLGIAVYLFVGLFVVTSGSILIPAAAGGAVVFAGALLVARYLFWEQEGTISFIAFRGGPWEVNFEYRGSKAAQDTSLVVNQFFQLKQDQDPRPPYLDEEDDYPYTPFT